MGAIEEFIRKATGGGDARAEQSLGLTLAATDDEEVINYASDERVRKRIVNEILPLVDAIRDNRQALNQQWHTLLKVWTLEHENPGYRGRSNVYMPAGKKGAETIVSQLVSGTFPGEDNFGVAARDPKLADQAVRVKEVLKHRIDVTAKLRTSAEPFYRQLVLTGNSPVKVQYRRKVLKHSRDRKGPKPTVLFDSPVFESIDASNFYVYPTTANRLSDAEIIFEDFTLPLATILQRARNGFYDKEEAKVCGKGQSRSSRVEAEQAKLSAQGLMTDQYDNRGGWSRVDGTEIWMDFDPKADSKEDEEEPEPFVITVTASGHVLRAIKNPYWHKRPPFLLGRMGTMQGRIYGTGFVEAIRQLNILLNDQTNQAMDCATYTLNPVVMTNPNYVLGTLSQMEPGVQWLVTDINAAVRFDRPPGDLIQGGTILTSQTQAWINDFIGAPPVLQGGAAPGRAFKTATGVGAAQTNAKLPLQEIVRLCEEDVWSPNLVIFNSLDQQFADEDLMVPSDGRRELLRIPPDDLAGDWLFDWMASTQTNNQAIKGSQISEALTLMSNPAIQALLKENGTRLNPVPLLRRLYTEVFGFRDVGDMIINAAMPELGPKGMGPPEIQDPGEEAAPGANEPPDLSEDLTNNASFQQTRAEADEISKLLGRVNVPGGVGAQEA
jgi:hypothetical protein